MDTHLERNVWLTAQDSCSSTELVRLIDEAVVSFRRAPGLDPMSRLHTSSIGRNADEVLQSVLSHCRVEFTADTVPSYIGLRTRLQEHVRRYLQWHLIHDGQASEPMQEDQLAADLGL